MNANMPYSIYLKLLYIISLSEYHFHHTNTIQKQKYQITLTIAAITTATTKKFFFNIIANIAEKSMRKNSKFKFM